ncbi:MAG: circadian clock protein KaiB [Williamsia sp.]|nr:circadian clock protein KaiB [Williamsia sp.]
MSKVVFTIYVAGSERKNMALLQNFREACSKFLSQSYFIQIIDIVKLPVVAEQKQILAVPTIIRERPAPERRIIGDVRQFANARKALEFLMIENGIKPGNEKESQSV